MPRRKPTQKVEMVTQRPIPAALGSQEGALSSSLKPRCVGPGLGGAGLQGEAPEICMVSS